MPPVFDHGYALLIGVDQNQVADWALPDVLKDIHALRDVLTRPDRCAYPPDHIHTVTGAEATRQGILDGFDWLRKHIKSDPDATAVVYYSGHGWRDNQSDPSAYYLIPYDVNENRLRTSALRGDDFAEEVDRLQPRRLLVLLDCCHAAGMGAKAIDSLTARYRPAALPATLFANPDASGAKEIGVKGLEQLQQGAGRCVLTSSSDAQSSYLRADETMSIFTYHLIEALTGHAQPQGGAREVLVSDLLSYVYRSVPDAARVQRRAEQQPDGRITGNFPVALLLGGKGVAKGAVPPDPVEDLPAAPTSSVTASGERAVAAGRDLRGNTIITGDGNTVQQATGRNIAQASGEGSATVNDYSGVDTGGGAFVGGNVNAEGDFVGRDRIVHGDEVHGDKISGDKITTGDISGSTVAIGRGATASSGIDLTQLDQLFAPVKQAIALSEIEAGQRAAALEKLSALEEELAKEERADDGRVAGLVDDLVGLVPGAVAAVVSAFGSPILAGLAGPVTKFVLDRLT